MHNCFLVVADMGGMVPDVDSLQVPSPALQTGEQGQADLSSRVFAGGVPEGMQPFVLGPFFHPSQSTGNTGQAPADQQGTSTAPSSAQVPTTSGIFSSMNIGPSLLFRMGGPMPAMPTANSGVASNARSNSAGLSSSITVIKFAAPSLWPCTEELF